MNISLIDVSELVAVVTIHPTVAVEVAFALLVTVRVADPVPPPTVKLPDNAVELADAFLMVSLLGKVITPAALMVVDAVAPKVETPMTPSVPFTVAPGVTSRPAAEIVVLAVAPKVETHVAPSVPLVKMLVLMVVAPCAMPALTKTTARARMVVRVALPRLFRYVLILFIMIDKYF